MLRVIGVGNADRGDDAAGFEVVRRLRTAGASGIEAVESDDAFTLLIQAWRGADRVVVVDAMRSGAPPGTVRCFDAVRDTLPVESFSAGSHGMGVAEAIELSRVLGWLPQELTVYGIEGGGFDAGAPMSPTVTRAVERLAAAIAGEATAA